MMGTSLSPRSRNDGDVVLSALVRSMPLGVLVVGSDGAITIANAHADAIFRARALELVGLEACDLLPELDAGVMGTEYEGTGRRLDGGDVLLRFRLQWVPVQDRRERVIYFCEASATALAGSRQPWHEELLNGTDLITEVDLDGRFLHVNHAAEHILGVAAHECVGMSGFDFIHPDDRDETVGHFAAWLNEGSSSTTLENRQIARSG
jgi:PAS domain-containing protein